MSNIPLSVVVGASHDSDTVRDLSRRLAPQLEAVGGELVIADGSTDGIAGVEVAVHMPGADVFALRAEGARRARGAIVALTEDHVMLAEDWCEAMLRAHAERPDMVGVVGPVVNGSTDTLMDWAHFLLTWAHFLPPLPPRDATRVPPAANLSLKRSVLDEHDLVPGRLELEILPHLHRIGKLLYDDRTVVAHIQPRGADAIVMHFHNGRASAALPRRRVPARELAVRALRCPVQPWRLTYRSFRETFSRPGYRRRAVITLPLVLVLAHAHTVGELCGMLAGPGKSPAALD